MFFRVSRYAPITATVGDILQFNYATNHNVYRYMTESCPSTWSSSQAVLVGSNSVAGGTASLPNRLEVVLSTAG